MSQNSCCVPGCAVVRKDGVLLHRFPNPETSAEKFKTWTSSIGGEIASMDHTTVFGNKRVCDKHFEKIYKYPSGRLSRLAIPTLHILDLQAQSIGEATATATTDISQTNQIQQSDLNTSGQEAVLSMSGLMLTPNIEATVSKPALASTHIEAIMSNPALASTSNILRTQSNDLISGQEAVLSMSGLMLTPNIEATVRKPALASTHIEAIMSNSALASTSNILWTHSNDLISGHQTAVQPEQTRCREHKIKTATHSKTPRVTRAQHKEFKSLMKKLRKCERDKKTFKAKYMIAKKIKATTAFNMVCKNMSYTTKLFCQMQASQSGKKKKGRRFTLDEKILALSLYKPSPKAYRLLSNICVLPSRRTLQNLLHTVNLTAGINDLIFKNLKKRVTKMPENYKYCSLTFDEMAIGAGIAYDKRNDKISGFVDNGDVIEREYCDHVLVFMVRGIVKKYKQPLAYYYCSGSTKTVELKKQIKTIIKKVQETGLKVVATVCDQGTSNVAAINALLKETRETFLRQGQEYKEGFFLVNKDKIFPIYDPPHLIKGIRNNLITKDLKFTMKGKECIAKWDHIVALYKRCPGYKGVKLVPKLTAHHVLPELIPKMRVKHCTQVFSQSVGVALGFMAGMGVLEKESVDTADLIMFFDDLFDSVNGSFSVIRGGKKYRTAVTPTSPHHKLWNYSLPILKSMKFINGNNLGVVPSLSSWIKTIEGLKLIVKYLSSKGINSLLLRNFNQDALENFFGAIRAHGYSNIMPTSSAFEGAFKTLLINNISSSHSVGSNCEKDDGVCLQSLKYFLGNPVDTHTAECADEIDSAHLNIAMINTDDLIQSQTPMLIERTAAIGYCSGWIAQLAKKHIYKNCVACRNCMEALEPQSFHEFIKRKEFGNKKWLCYPTRALFDFFAQVEHVCIEILKDHSNKKNILVYMKLIININIDTTFISCNEHEGDLRHYLINKSALFFINNWCKDVNNVLTGKITFWDVNDPMKQKANRHFLNHKGRKRRTQNYVLNV